MSMSVMHYFLLLRTYSLACQVAQALLVNAITLYEFHTVSIFSHQNKQHVALHMLKMYAFPLFSFRRIHL